MGLLTYRERKKHKKKLTIDMEAEALQESINYHMCNREYQDAISKIKEIWLLKTRPWIYSSTMVTYIECLIREGHRDRDIAVVEKQLLTLYRSVIDIPPRLLMNFAQQALTRSSSRRAVYAALMSYYACVLAQNAVRKEKAMRLSVEGAHLIKEVVQILRHDEIKVADYLLKLMEELKGSISGVITGDDKKIEIRQQSVDKAKSAIFQAQTSIEKRRSQKYSSHSTRRDRRSNTKKSLKYISSSSQAPSSSKDRDFESKLEGKSSRESDKRTDKSRTPQPSLLVSLHGSHKRSRHSYSRTASSNLHSVDDQQLEEPEPLPGSSLSGIITTSDEKPVPYDELGSPRGSRQSSELTGSVNRDSPTLYKTVFNEQYV